VCETRLVRISRRLQRTIDKFREDPASVRNAAWLIITATVVAVLAGALVVWLFAHGEYPNYGRALWFTLQTVTTVGYGDVTPTSPVGRIVGGVVMLIAIGFITIVTAAITSTFVEAARRRADEATDAAEAETAGQIQAAITSMGARLDAIEATLETIVEQTRPV
jgi:voltage-gated potassium channel